MDYFKDREKKASIRLRNIRNQLPEFCEEFFIGIEPQTSVLTRLNYAYDLRVFFDFLLKNVRAFREYRDVYDFVVKDLEKITITNLESYMEYLTFFEFEGKECSNDERAKARKLSTVRSFFKYFYNKDAISNNVASKIALPKIHNKDIIRLETNEVEKILNAADTLEGMSDHQRKINLNTRSRDVAILTLLLGTGIRVSECVGLNIQDIDFDNNAFTVTRKGGNKAILYFGDEVKEALLDYTEGKRKFMINHNERIYKIDEDALFYSSQMKRISVRAVENIVKKYAQVASPLKNISPHKLRSTFGTSLYRETGDIYMVADVLGHRDVNTTKKHYAAIEEDHRKLAAKVIKLRNDDDEK